MAEKTEFTEEQMIKKLKEWTKDKNMIDGGTFNRCMKACFGKPYEAIKSTVESSIWPKHQDKPTRKVCLDEKVKVVALVYEVGTLLKKDAAEMRKAIVETKVGPTATTFSKTGGVDKMTDASKYTGAHKERFRADGKGKGIEGRVDKVEGSGYVGNYKNKDTYDKKH